MQIDGSSHETQECSQALTLDSRKSLCDFSFPLVLGILLKCVDDLDPASIGKRVDHLR